ncbi:unnamed protein product [Microthlaspi erraticum]|uniref:Uncharacterized protein n=1 Tax=Microthlaspi erraticum TaxID=1685480 RepID=A0A6D2K1P9_9BRAS|nr:unnamed protein product [Microthlaspi erraticum]
MVDSSNKKRKASISEGDIATLLQRYDTMTILKLLQEMAHYAEPKMDWNELVRKSTTGITSAREYQLLWRHLAYRNSLLPVEDGAQLPDDDSDMECELETSPAVSVDVVSEAMAHVKVIAASYVPSESDIPEDSMVEAPLTINIPYGLQRGPQDPSDSYWSSRGLNITFPVSLQKAADGPNGNGLATSIAPRKRRKKWSSEEDDELIAAVKRHGEGSWALIAKEEFEGERTASQLSQRWGAIKRRCETSNTVAQSGIQRTEEQMAANHALYLAVGNPVPSKKPAVGIPPVLSSRAQANGATSGSSLQGQHSQPVVQALPRGSTSVPAAKSRLNAKKSTANSSSRAELMVTANSAAAAACMSNLATTASLPKVEAGKNAVPVLVPKAEPVKVASTSTASLPRPSARNAEPVKPAPAASLPRPSAVSPALNAESVKPASAASLPHPSKAEPVKPASATSLPRQSGITSAPKTEPVKTAPAAVLPRQPGIVSAPKTEPVKTAPAVSLPRPSSIPSAPKAEPVKSTIATATATNTQAVGPLNIRNATNGTPKPVISSAPSSKPSHMAPFSKGPTIQNTSVPSGFASSRLAPVQRVPAANVMPQKPSAGVAATTSYKPVVVQKEQTQATVMPQKPGAGAAVPTTYKPVVVQKEQSQATVMPQKPNVGAEVIASSKPVGVQKVQTQATAMPQKPSVGPPVTAIGVQKVQTQATSMPQKPTVAVTPVGVQKEQSQAALMPQKPTVGAAVIPVGVHKEQSQATVMPQKPTVGAAVNASYRPVGVQKEQPQVTRATAPQPNKTMSTSSVISTGKLVSAKLEIPPSLMPLKNLVPLPPEKESSTTVSPIVRAAAESNPKDEASKGKSPDVAAVAGTGQKSS